MGKSAPFKVGNIRFIKSRGDGDYGFIRMDNGEEIFFHESKVIESSANRLRAGDRVFFDPEIGHDGKLRAVNVFKAKS